VRRLPTLLAFSLIATSALAERTLNRGLHAVPAPGAVKIDGDLADWDLSGAITCCKDVEHLLDTESCRVAAMWDKENLYLAFVFRDATPMQNNVDPVTMRGNGWRSDAAQLRCNMAGFISHIDAWYYTPGKKPAMTVHYGPAGAKDAPKVDRPPYPEQLGAEEAFRAAPDGKGYTQEIKLPWKVITVDGKMPPKGADLRLGLEMFWGDRDAQSWPRSRVTDNLAEGETQTDFFWTNTKAWGRLILEEKGQIKLPPPPWQAAKKPEPQGPVAIKLSLFRDSFVTLAIEDEAGNRVRSLLGGRKFEHGDHTVTWSGLDDRERVLPPGRYRWVGFTRDPIEVRWRMSFYQPNRRVPWTNAAGTGAWGPDHGNLLAVATGEGRVFLGGLGAEAGIPLFACDEKGNKLWSIRSGEPDHLAYADGVLYAYTSRGDSNWLGITPRGVMEFDAKTGQWLDIVGGDGKPTRRLALLDDKEMAAGFAADKDGLYLSVKDKSVIRAFDRKTFQPKRDYPLPGAGPIFALGNGRLLVATPKAILLLDLRSGATKTLFTGDFAAAQAVTCDARDTLCVAMGAPLHQVWLYRRAWLGMRREAIGRAGGRTQNGWYDPREGFLNPCSVAFDASGQLWVVENGQRPKRVSVWRNGRWVHDFIGDTGYGGGGVINPVDPTMAFYGDMQFRIDLATGDWQLKQLGFVLPEGAEKFGLARGAGDHATGSDLAAEYMMAFRGGPYVMTCRGVRQVFRERRDGRWALCLHIDPKEKIAWTDLNDDCKVQENEISRGGQEADWGGTDYWGMRPSQNLDLYFTRGVAKPGLRLRLRGMTPGGTPVYDFSRFEPMAGECQNGIGLRDGSYNSGCAGERGDYFGEMRRIFPGGVARRCYWFRGENTGRWTYRLPEPGVVLYPFQAHGVADLPEGGEVVCWVSDFGQRYLFTDDMLYIDQLFADARSSFENWPDEPKAGFLANPMAPGQESFHGFFTRLADGRYILTSGFTDCRVFEITGLDSIKRMAGEIELKPEHMARVREIRDFRLAGGKGRSTFTIRRIAKPPALDGKLAGWSREGAARIPVDAERSAEVLTACDQDNLYVAWAVRDPSPMLNTASRWELAFKGGDAVDLMWRPPREGEAPAGPLSSGHRLADPVVRPGDLRLLITVSDGKPRAVLYRPVSPTKHPFAFDAFQGAGRGNAVVMDEVRLADEIKAAIQRGKDGYVVQAAIPWSLLGGVPKAGAEARIDFGVLFGDPQGGPTVLRAYWSNKETNITSDIPSEARLQPGNWSACRIQE